MLDMSAQRMRVNGAFMQQNHGKQVCLVGTLVKAEGGGSAFQVRASDGAMINIRLKQPISEALTGVIEVNGLGQGKNLVVAESYTLFPSNGPEFDMAAYNEVVAVINNVDTNNLFKPSA